MTAIIAFFIYASRLYSYRAVIAAIPRSYLPIGRGEVAKSVRRIIVKNRQRSALVTFESRPRDIRPELSLQETEEHVHRSRLKHRTRTNDSIISISASSPPWGDIIHPGWSSPASDDIPDLRFSTVIEELPNLIEAKAVSLAPPDSTYDFMAEFHDSVPPPPDPRVVAVLQRPSAMGLREYVAHLIELDIISPPELSDAFIKLYEFARFSSEALTEAEFRSLMNAFSDLVASMTAFDPHVLSDYESSEPSIRQDNPAPAPSVSSLEVPRRSNASDTTSLRSNDSVLHHTSARETDGNG